VSDGTPDDHGNKQNRQAMLTGPARGLPGGYHSLGSASMGRCGA